MIIRCIALRLNGFIMDLFLKLMSMMEIFLTNSYQLFILLNSFSATIDLKLGLVSFPKKNLLIVAAVQL